MIKYGNIGIKGSLVLAFALSALAYFGECSVSVGKLATSRRITTETQLEKTLKEEKEKLGLQEVNISARFGDSPLGLGHTRKLSKNNFSIVLDDFFYLGKNRTNLRHELYHVYDSHNNRTIFYFWSEFKANLYANHNIKL